MIYFYNDTGVKNYLRFHRDATTLAFSASVFQLNTWYHIVCTSTDIGIANFYIDGVLSGTANQNSGTPTAGTTNIIIGNRNAGDRTFDGRIADLIVWEAA